MTQGGECTDSARSRKGKCFDVVSSEEESTNTQDHYGLICCHYLHISVGLMLSPMRL